MNNTYLLSKDTVKTIAQGALGAMTFGAYHQYTTNKIMELNNEKMDLKNEKFELQQKYLIDKMNTEHNNEMKVLKEKFEKLEKKKSWWY